ncbi:MAG: putative Ig domain-containing protein [Deltaproteobacteria bacterium]|nr:putative Ig domain-containing protein [Deltaproteobacteria bacterium]
MHRTHAPWLFTLSLVMAACGGETTNNNNTNTNTPITIETTSLPGGQQGVAYSAEIRAKGGSGEGYKWSVSGSLPPGLFMSSGGTTDGSGNPMTTILGTPTGNGTYSFDVRLADDTGQIGSASLQIVVDAAPPALGITTTSMPDGGTNQAYSASITAANGTPPYRWLLVSGALPPGLTLGAEGDPSTTLAGTPLQAGAFEFTVRVRDADNAQADQKLKVTIADTTQPLQFTTTDLPDGQVGLLYTAELTAVNGTPPYSWLLVGDAPPGLDIDESVSPALLTGVPTTFGSYTFQIEVEDAQHVKVRRTFFVEISRAPPVVRLITVELPDGEVASAYSAELQGINGSGPYTWSVQGNLPPGLALTQNQADPLLATLSGTPTTEGTYAFGVQIADARGDTSTVDFTVVILPQIFPIEIVSTSSGAVTLAPAVQGLAYSATITARDGFGRYHWVVSQGALPAGLTLQIAGKPSTVVSGAPTVSGNFTFSVTVYDDNNETDTQDFTLLVVGGGT